jgi:hypothetical protein
MSRVRSRRPDCRKPCFCGVSLPTGRFGLRATVQAPTSSTSLRRVPLTVRVKLVNGDTHRIELPDDDAADVLRRLNTRADPFNSDWVDGGNGELVRMSAIVSMYVEPGGGRPQVG